MRDFIVIKKGCQPRANTVNAGLVEAVAVDIDKVSEQFHHIVLLLVQPFDNRFTHLFPLSGLSVSVDDAIPCRAFRLIHFTPDHIE